VKSLETNDEIDTVLNQFGRQFNLSDVQVQQFHKYCLLLQEWNKKVNLTAIIHPQAIVADHFQDSLQVSSFFDFSTISTISDVGAGAGFPSIPLKILYPHLAVVLIEVVKKKIMFLEKLVATLGLENVVISSLDWRTFLRKTTYQIDVFFARASVSVDELIRMFKPACHYRNAWLIYWASRAWSIPAEAQPFVQREEWYSINNKKRRYIFFHIP